MALSGGPEAARTAIAATLTTYLLTELDALWTAAGDVATVPKPYTSPLNIVIHQRPLEFDYPLVHLVGRKTGNALSGAPQWGLYTHHVRGMFFVQGDTPQVVDQQAARFGWALVKVIEKHQPLDGSISGLSGIICAGLDTGTANPDLVQAGYVDWIVNIDETL